MPLPVIFGGLSAALMSDLDQDFAAVGALTIVPCTVTGTNTLALSPSPNSPAITVYTDYLQFSAVAAATNTGATTAAIGALPALPVYKDSGGGPVALVGGEIVANNLFELVYDSALASGSGGFHLNTETAGGTPFVAAHSLFGNAGTVLAEGGNIAIGANLSLTSGGTLNATAVTGTTTTIVAGAGLTGGTITASGTIGLAAASLNGVPTPSPAGLKIQVTSSSALTVTATGIMVTNGSGGYQLLAAFNQSIATGTTGAGGLDTGILAPATWYNVFAIYGTTGTAAMLSLSATAPTMPSGYTYFARVGAVRTASGSAVLLATLQYGRDVQWVPGGANLATLPAIVNGTTGDPTVPTWTAISVSIVVPPTACKIRLLLGNNGYSGGAIVAPNNSYGSETGFPAVPGLYIGSQNVIQGEFILESSNIYYASNSTGCYVSVLGWSDNL